MARGFVTVEDVGRSRFRRQEEWESVFGTLKKERGNPLDWDCLWKAAVSAKSVATVTEGIRDLQKTLLDRSGAGELNLMRSCQPLTGESKYGVILTSWPEMIAFSGAIRLHCIPFGQSAGMKPR